MLAFLIFFFLSRKRDSAANSFGPKCTRSASPYSHWQNQKKVFEFRRGGGVKQKLLINQILIAMFWMQRSGVKASSCFKILKFWLSFIALFFRIYVFINWMRKSSAVASLFWIENEILTRLKSINLKLVCVPHTCGRSGMHPSTTRS